MIEKVWLIGAVVLGLSINSMGELILSEKLDIAKVWSAHPVPFEIQNNGNFQYIGYYDTLRRMTIAKRAFGTIQWQKALLPITTGWDSHNSINLAFDDSGYIHMSGNMHHAPLVYYRTTKPYDITTFVSAKMTGINESSVTYPVFTQGPKGEFLFDYRDGGSGNGNTVWNIYNLAKKTWSRYTEAMMFDGEGLANAYPFGPFLHSDGYYYIPWLWREEVSANTCHDLSLIRSKDLLIWETMAGQKLSLPIKRSTAGVVADPVKTLNGLTNMDVGLGWDSKDRPVITYHKYLTNGTTQTSQLWNARYEGSSWKIYQTSNFTGFKFALDIAGSLPHSVYASPVFIDASGRLLQYYNFKDNPRGQWELDETTMKPKTDSVWQIPAAMKDFYKIESSWKGSPAMQLNTKQQGEYYIRWETLPPNNDDARNPPYPEFGMLQVYKFTYNTTAIHAEKVAAPKIVSRAILTNHTLKVTVGTIMQGQTWSIQVFNLNGSMIAQKQKITSKQVVWNTSNWTNGVYCIRINSQDKVLSEKIGVY